MMSSKATGSLWGRAWKESLWELGGLYFPKTAMHYISYPYNVVLPLHPEVGAYILPHECGQIIVTLDW